MMKHAKKQGDTNLQVKIKNLEGAIQQRGGGLPSGSYNPDRQEDRKLQENINAVSDAYKESIISSGNSNAEKRVVKLVDEALHQPGNNGEAAERAAKFVKRNR